MFNLVKIPARKSAAVTLHKGWGIKIINTRGHQVVDTWAFRQSDMGEFLSTEHTRQKLNSIFPIRGEPLYTNKRRPILVMEEDTSPGIHDTLMAACDVFRYQQLGCTGYHENCDDNLHNALREMCLKIEGTPSPVNLWMNIPISTTGQCGWQAPVASAGDFVYFRAVVDCIIVMSACPQDLVPINAGNPVEVHYSVFD